jgi:hypothetical protein
MRRIQLFEFTDLAWYPQPFRRMKTDYLQFATSLGSGHKNLVPLFIRAIRHANTTEIMIYAPEVLIRGYVYGRISKKLDILSLSS